MHQVKRKMIDRSSHVNFSLMLAILLICVLPFPLQAAETRFALVIGNSTYENTTTLKNPKNDAADMSKALEGMGFDVTMLEDAKLVEMQRALRDFGKKSRGSDISLVYYAGHGMEVDNQNYLVPTDAVLASDQDIEWEAIPLDVLNRAVSGAKGVSMILLDACRNNPFANKMQTSQSSRSIGRGLAPVEPTNGSLISFAAREGTVADDGNGRNSPYTAALLKHIVEPGVDIRRIFDKVRDSVMATTNKVQQPFVYSSLPGRDVLLTPKIITPVKATPQINTSSLDLEYWNSVKDTGSADLLQSYLVEFENGKFAKIAKFKLGQLGKPKAKAEAVTVAPKESKSSSESNSEIAGVANNFLRPFEKLKHHKAAAEQGDVNSQFTVGMMYYLGNGIPLDRDEAVKWFTLAANQNLPKAQYQMGQFYNGLDANRDYENSIKFYDLAAQNGHIEAQVELAKIYASDYFGSADLEASVKYYSMAAAQNHGEALYQLALAYRSGRGIKRDEQKALKLFFDAAKHGESRAYIFVGRMYETGQGVDLDFKTAAQYYEKGVQEGQAVAMYYLGIFYEKGLGVPRDRQKAIDLYKSAAEKGSSLARKQLSRLSQ